MTTWHNNTESMDCTERKQSFYGGRCASIRKSTVYIIQLQIEEKGESCVRACKEK